jgi:hypothetical protein
MDKYNIACNITHDTCNDTGHKGRENKSDSKTDEPYNQYCRKKKNPEASKLEDRIGYKRYLSTYLHSANHISSYMPSTL